jgi:succinate dehydrogenase/fumarate reductase-like Fe-S protein
MFLVRLVIRKFEFFSTEAKSKEQRAKSKEQRAKSKEQRAKSKEQRNCIADSVFVKSCMEHKSSPCKYNSDNAKSLIQYKKIAIKFFSNISHLAAFAVNSNNITVQSILRRNCI